MRKLENQANLFSTPLNKIRIMKSRHELSFSLTGLIYVLEYRPDLLELVNKDLTSGKSNKKGREGMPASMAITLWIVRNSIDGNYAELEWILHNDKTILQILGDNPVFPITLFDEKTIHQNLKKLKKETIDAISEAIINIGKEKGFEKGGKIRGDSFVCKVNTHYPSESKLLYDCIRGIIKKCVEIDENIIGRKHDYHRKKIKKNVGEIGKIRQSKRKKEIKKIEEKKSHKKLINSIEEVIDRVKKNKKIGQEILKIIKNEESDITLKKYTEIAYTVMLTEKIIKLAERRIFDEEKIPNSEKILSIYEQDVELIKRGKYPIEIEFGHKIFVHESESGFIVDYAIMSAGSSDAEQIKPSLEKIKNKYSLEFKTGTYDKGFHTPENQKQLTELFIDNAVVIPKKGKLNKEEYAKEHEKKYIKTRLWRAGVESLISCLVRGNGLGLCPDKGRKNYDRYVAGCILARNMQKLGEYLQAEESKKVKKAA